MFVAVTREEKTRCKITITLVLDPARVKLLTSGQPLTETLNQYDPNLTTQYELRLAYTPDIEYVEEQTGQGHNLEDVLQNSLNREPVVHDSNAEAA